jgi:hypothetical protein
MSRHLKSGGRLVVLELGEPSFLPARWFVKYCVSLSCVVCRVSCVVCRVPCAVCRVSVRLLLIRQVLGNTNSVGGGHCCVFLKSGPNLESPANGRRPWARCRGRPQN